MNLDALFKICYGLYIVSSKKGKKINAQLSNTVFQITPQPATIAISIAKQNLTHEFIKESNVFTVSIVSDKWTMIEIGRRY
jgi:flavin reductase (DIM6/NTAB) family NADH-FMN oxidoreductase RutF